MSPARTKTGLTVLQWALGVVILIEAVRFVLPSAAHDFARTHMPGFVRMVLGFGEILGCVLLFDSADRDSRGVGAGGCVHHGHSASPAAWDVWDRESGDLCGSGLRYRDWQGEVGTA